MPSGRRTGISTQSRLTNEAHGFQICRPIGIASNLVEHFTRQGIKGELNATVAEWID